MSDSIGPATRETDPIIALRDSDLTWRETAGEVVALDLRTSRYLQISSTGLDLWVMLTVGATRAELVEHLLACYEVDQLTAATDVAGFLDGLRDRDLIVES